ncbi:MAG: PLP-dependent aminotransferase family protein [Burkholderiales bacterium]|jgi:DNA-binding transcriptional MocR family regulator|nr:PLP-dependent aminotransferase family protein [Burkholderiales bacterium]HQY08570.1 PLP-dependent aminotransferase family protein [Burkholderiaceae bacterium]
MVSTAPTALHDSSYDSLYLQIAERMAQSIRSGTLVRGERLPSVREQARRQGVSPATIVQAYRALEDARLIEARPRSGYYVAARPARLPEPEPSAPPAASLQVDVSSIGEQVMRLAADPSVISFGAACPSGELFAQERVRRAVSRAAQRHRATLCRYPLGPGNEALRRAIARHALGLGCQLEARDIVVTNGALEAISLCLRAVTQPGDVVALESPTYFGFLEILESMHLRALEIPTHPRTGLSLDALQLAFDTQPVKAVLAVPTLSNPLGACLPAPERRRLALMVAERGIPLIEDVIYNDLAERDDLRRAVKAWDSTGHVMLCGSFSKTVAPGLRVGWIEGGRWGAQLRRLKAVHSGAQTELVELAMADLLTQPGHESAWRALRATIAARVDEARGLIAESFPKGTRVTDPAGGFILWVELPAGSDSVALFRACLAERICIAPGTMFSATGRFNHCIRLGVGGRWDAPQRAALARVGAIACAMARGAAAESKASPGLRLEALLSRTELS